MVPIVAHVVYDVLTFLEVHQRATAQLKTALEGVLPQKEQVTRAARFSRAAVAATAAVPRLRLMLACFVPREAA